MVLLSLWMLNAVEKRFFSSKRVYLLKIHATRTHGVLNEISSLLERQGVVIIRLSTEEDDRNENEVDLRITMSVKLPKGMKALLLADEVRELKFITGVYVEYGA
jgi:putative Mg2+ transporter-C (MgtC) family protein